MEIQLTGLCARVAGRRFQVTRLSGLVILKCGSMSDEVSLTQQVRCKIGLHRGRVEPLGGGICFCCSYCGSHSKIQQF